VSLGIFGRCTPTRRKLSLLRRQPHNRSLPGNIRLRSYTPLISLTYLAWKGRLQFPILVRQIRPWKYVFGYIKISGAIPNLSIFIPVSHNILIDDKIYILIDDKIYDVIKHLRGEIPRRRECLHNNIGVGASAPGLSYTEAKDMTFSGRVFIYTIQNFTIVQLGELATWYQGANMSLQIRGHDYWFANKDR
jgi:hypothetical protein